MVLIITNIMIDITKLRCEKQCQNHYRNWSMQYKIIGSG